MNEWCNNPTNKQSKECANRKAKYDAAVKLKSFCLSCKDGQNPQLCAEHQAKKEAAEIRRQNREHNDNYSRLIENSMH